MKLNFRFVFLLSCIISFFFLIVLRLTDIQLVRGKFYRGLSEDNRFYSLPIKSQRGAVFDRYGNSLVSNIVQYGLVKDPKSLYSSIKIIDREDALFQLATNSALVVKDNSRYYQYPALSHLLGYVGEVTAEELNERNDLRPHDKLGKLGIEKFFDQELRGRDGKEVFEISASSKKQRSLNITPSISGLDIKTNLDPELSQVAFDALGEQKGTVIISNPSNGEILSLVTKPSFDANLFSEILTDEKKDRDRKELVTALFEDENQPFFNRAIAGAYPPGSVFKLVTALAGLEEEEIDQNTTVLDEGVLKVGEAEFRSWFYWSYGKTEGLLDLRRAISRSNDIYFYKVAEWVGVEKLATMARVFGFGEYTDIEIGPEARGLVPTPEWKEQAIGEKWYLGNTYHMGIGQGDVLVSPLQINGLIQAVANEGVWCQPRLVADTSINCKGLGIKPENISLVLSGMVGACTTGGTAFPFFVRNSLVNISNESDPYKAIDEGAVACKTGTAEFGAADEDGFRPTHAWFIAYLKPKVSKDNFPSKVVITVLIESDDQDSSKEGSYDAAPVAKEIVDYIESR
jgi:penicillin-binding protein 2